MGSEKGYMFAYEITISQSEKRKCHLEPFNDGTKRGKERVDVIKYLPRCHMVAVLTNN